MAKTNYASVDAYLAAQPPAAREKLAKVRASLKRALPKCEEVISYQIPCFKLDGSAVIYFAGWAKHFSVYPVTDALLAEMRDEIQSRHVSRGTLKFEYDEPIPLALIGRVARFRARETADLLKERAAKKAAKKKSAKKR